MTDLERVKDAAWAHLKPNEYRDDILALIDAHLEEDAEREAAWSSKAEDYIIELTELREQMGPTATAGRIAAVKVERLRAVGEDILVHGENIENRARLRQLIEEKE